MAKDTAVQVDIPCDVQQIDNTGYVWTLLDEARDPSVITPGAIIIAAGEEDPVFARVVDLVPHGERTIVHLELLPATRSSTRTRSVARTSSQPDHGPPRPPIRRCCAPVPRDFRGIGQASSVHPQAR